MEVFGAAGDPYVLAASPGTASIALAPFGTLLLDPSILWLLGSGAIGPDGVKSVGVPVGPDPMLVGKTVWWQALVGAPLAFTNREPTPISAL